MVELQELVDRQLVAAGQGASPLRKAWRRRCLSQIAMSIQVGYCGCRRRMAGNMTVGK